jgi:hypothetical protein
VSISGIAFNSQDSAAIVAQFPLVSSCGGAGALRVTGSFFGLSAGGSPVGSGSHIIANGVVLELGGAAAADRNVLASAGGGGVHINGMPCCGGSRIDNNVFGRSVEPDQTASNGSFDVRILNSSDNRIGESAPNAFHATPVAILVSGPNSQRNAIARNSFDGHDGATAIDLADGFQPDGIDPNDGDDADTGPNARQNTPVLGSATATAGGVTINGILDVPAGIATPVPYTLAFYESDSCSDESGAGNGREGQIPLGTVAQPLTSTTETFSLALVVPPFASGRFLTATATSPDGSTSELSNCLAAPRATLLFADSFE